MPFFLACPRALTVPGWLIRCVLTALIGLATCLSGWSQTVSVTAMRPASVAFALPDLWIVILVNHSQLPVEGLLIATVTERRRGIVLKVSSSPFRLETGAGSTRQFSAAAYRPLEPIRMEFTNPDFRSALARTNQLPAGEYEVCLTFRATGLTAREDHPVSCYDLATQAYTAPELLFPADNDTIGQASPVFTWLPPAPIRPGELIAYQFILAEVLHNQSPVAAVLANAPWLGADQLTIPTLQYPLGNRSLVDNRRYAWRVRAFREGQLLAESEVKSFVFRKNPAVSSQPPASPKQTVYFSLEPEDRKALYQVKDHTLPFVYRNEEGLSEVVYRITSRERHIDVQGKITQQPGYNLNQLDLHALPSLVPGYSYSFEILDSSVPKRFLQFQYDKP